jgi:exo-beta-1,3-glucanase (GH17 family)
MWNVLSLYGSGTRQNLIKVTQDYKTDFLAVQEVHSVALYGTQCGTVQYTVWHYTVHSVALYCTQCGTVQYTVWHCRVHSVALYGTQCGTI